MCSPPDDQFPVKNGKADEKGKNDVEKNEEASAPFPCDIRKTPKRAEADGRTGCSHDKAEARRPMFVEFRHAEEGIISEHKRKW